MTKDLKKKSKKQGLKKSTGTNAILVNERKSEWGPMMDAIAKTGVDIIVHGEEGGYRNVIQFENDGGKVKRVPCVKFGWWMNDYRPVKKLSAIPDVDVIFLCNNEFKDEYKKIAPTYYMPQCGMDKPLKDAGIPTWDVLFIGNVGYSEWHNNRGSILKYLSLHTDLKIFAGQNFTKPSPWFYAQSMFSLAISPQGKGYTSNRLYNILSAGGLCITLWFPGIEELFVNHKHLLWFKTKEEAVELMEYYYDKPKERRKIMEAGQELYLKEHTAQKRLDKMFSLMDGEVDTV